MENAPAQNNDVTAEYPALVDSMTKAYGKFWDEARLLMINDGVLLAGEKYFHVDYNAPKASSGSPDWKAPALKWEESYTGEPTGLNKTSSASKGDS